jgi:ATP-binding cassette subfamily B protein/subfamily B ATP-binding cassette protein MsbA
MVAVFALMLAQMALMALTPWPLKVIVDNALGKHPLPTWLQAFFVALPGPATRAALIWWAAGATIALFVLGWGANLAVSWASVRFGQSMSYDLACDLLEHLQRLSLRFHARHGIGSLMRRITGDSGCVATIVQEAVLPTVTAVSTVTMMLSLMWVLDPLLTAVALCVIPLMLLAFRLYASPMLARSYERQVAEAQIYATIEQTLGGLQVIQAFGRERQADERFRTDTDRTLAATIALTWAQVRFKLLIGAAVAVGAAGIFWLGGEEGMAGRVTVGSLLVFLSYLNSLYQPLHDISYSNATVTEAAGSARRVLEVLDAPLEVVDAPGAVRLGRVAGRVVFEDVWFGYEPGRPVLRGVSFEARPGEVVAVVGATGAGKSTLASLLPRFFDPDRGRVLLDGHDLRELELERVRASVGLVLQESFLFPFSIAENIAFARPGASQQEIEAAALAANAHRFICALPRGYETVVGERGATLSGGERQRIAIARALLKDAPVLILDEPTSALDADTEASVLDALERLMAGRTTIIIAHRLSTIRRAERIIVLDHGRPVEAGTHHQLLHQHGHYAHLHTRQRDHGVVVG